jgi:hypothetical protein
VLVRETGAGADAISARPGLLPDAGHPGRRSRTGRAAVSVSVEGAPRRVILGYGRVDEHTGPQDRAELARALTRFADREGYALGELFVQTDALAPGAAFLAITDAARRREDVAAVVIPDMTHLGDTEERRGTMLAHLRRVTDVPVLVTTPRGSASSGPGGYPTAATGRGAVTALASLHTRSKASR